MCVGVDMGGGSNLQSDTAKDGWYCRAEWVSYVNINIYVHMLFHIFKREYSTCTYICIYVICLVNMSLWVCCENCSCIQIHTYVNVGCCMNKKELEMY